MKLITIGDSDNNSHKILNIFGLKISIKNKGYADNVKTFKKYKKNNIDITTFPKATGQMREIQLANYELLLFFDKLCKENNLTYWLDFGTLLGAVRHKGYIPWDDDIDISMLRQDYDKVIDIVNNNKYNSDIYAEHHKHPKYFGKYFHLKIMHKKCPYLFVDIFPYDYLGKKLTYEEQLLKTEDFKRVCDELYDSYPSNPSEEYIEERLYKTRSHILSHEVNNETSDLVWGIDFKHRWDNWIHPNDMIFPLQKIEFEGNLFNVPNDYNAYLKDLFKNYMDYPENISRVHSAYIKITNPEEIKFIKNFANSNNTEI